MDKNLISLIFTVVAVILIAVGVFFPWYNFQLEVKSNIIQVNLNIEIKYYLSRAVFSGETFGNTISHSYDYSEILHLISRNPWYDSERSTIKNVLGIFDTTLYIIIFTFIFSIGALISAIVSLFDFNKYEFLIFLNKVFISLTSCLAIGAIFYFMFAWNSMIQCGISMFLSLFGPRPILLQHTDMSFWYGFNLGGSHISMGPGYAWEMVIIAAIFMFIAAVLNYKNINLEKSKQ